MCAKRTFIILRLPPLATVVILLPVVEFLQGKELLRRSALRNLRWPRELSKDPEKDADLNIDKR